MLFSSDTIAKHRSFIELNALPMPDSIATAVFIFSAVLILIALLGGKFKIFGSEISESVSNPFIRFVAFAIGAFLLVLVLDIQAPFNINIFGAPSETQQVERSESAEPGFSLPFSEPIEELTWSSTASSIKDNVDQDFRFNCPKGGTINRIYGTDIYTSGSSICSAAVHAGLITARDGGNVKVRVLGSQDFFNGMLRHGVTSQRYGDYNSSYTFLEGRKPLATEQTQRLDWNDTASSISGRLDQEFEFECPENGAIGRVTGTDIYTTGSSICSAAVHAGVISAREGGRVKIQILGSQEFFNGSERNGVASRKYGDYGSSFTFVEPS